MANDNITAIIALKGGSSGGGSGGSVTPASIGAVAVSQGTANAGKFLVVGSDGNVTPVTMTEWQGGSY